MQKLLSCALQGNRDLCRENFLNKVRGTELERSLKTAENSLDEIMNKCSYMWISLADLFKVAKA